MLWLNSIFQLPKKLKIEIKSTTFVFYFQRKWTELNVHCGACTFGHCVFITLLVGEKLCRVM